MGASAQNDVQSIINAIRDSKGRIVNITSNYIDGEIDHRYLETIKSFMESQKIKHEIIQMEYAIQGNSGRLTNTSLSGSNYNEKLDIVLIPEGYTKEEMNKFKEDTKKFAKYLLECSPYKENANKINIWAVLAESKESGTDMPPLGVWKNTILNSRFWTFKLERYLMIEDNKTLRNIASNVPYDQIYVIVNTNKYGGGAIYNHYAVCVRENTYENYVFVHEFGHAFAGLGDEYYTSSVAYNEFYKLDVEPWEPNLTTLVNFDKKWK